MAEDFSQAPKQNVTTIAAEASPSRGQGETQISAKANNPDGMITAANARQQDEFEDVGEEQMRMAARMLYDSIREWREHNGKSTTRQEKTVKHLADV